MKLSGEDFSLYADKIESVGLRTRAQQFVKRFALALSDRRLSVLSCPVCDVRALWPNGWTDQGETWLAGRPRSRPHWVRRGPSSSSSKGAQPLPQYSAHVRCGQTAGWIKMPLGVEVGLGPGDIVLDEDPVTPPLKGAQPPIFGPCLLWPNGHQRQSQILLGSFLNSCRFPRRAGGRLSASDRLTSV